jgi:hypothetical protein
MTQSYEQDNTSVYPNPSTNSFTLHQPGTFTYSISNGSGKVLESGKSTDQVAIGRGLPSGLFVLRIQNPDGSTKTMRLSKQ